MKFLDVRIVQLSSMMGQQQVKKYLMFMFTSSLAGLRMEARP